MRFLQRQGFIVHGVWGCGGDFDDLVRAGAAAANLVVTAAGLPAAAVLQERFGQPYVAAAALNDAVTAALKLAAADAAYRVFRLPQCRQIERCQRRNGAESGDCFRDEGDDDGSRLQGHGTLAARAGHDHRYARL